MTKRRSMKTALDIFVFLPVWFLMELPKLTETTGSTPVVTIPQVEYSAPFGINTTLQCYVTSLDSEVISVSWIFDDSYRTQVIMVLPTDVDNDKYKGGNISYPSLLIRNLTKKDEGLYKCSATNMFGTGVSNFTRLFVKGNAPIVIIPREEYFGELGRLIIIGCIISSPDTTLDFVIWTFDNGSTTPIIINIPPNVNNSKYQGGNVSYPSLFIQHLTKRDEGRYKCSGRNMFGAGKSNTTRLTVQGYPPRVFVPVMNYTGDIRTDIVLECLIMYSLSEVISVSWTFNNGNKSQIITLASPYGFNDKYMGSNVSYPSLFIRNLTKKDEGFYKCSATNMFGTGLSSSTVLIVEGHPPYVQIYQTQYVGKLGTNIWLNCSILSTDSEVISVSWIFNKTESASKIHAALHDIKAKYIPGTFSYLPLLKQNLTKDDEGWYTCSATNIFGSGFSNATFLTVKDLPVISIASAEYNSSFGQLVTMHCEINSSTPIIKVYWERNSSTEGITITSKLSGIEGSTIEDPSLTILVTSYPDSGIYTCFAENIDGIGYSKPVKLHVSGGIPRINSHSSLIHSSYGKRVTLSVTISSSPDYFNIYWEKSLNGIVSVIHSGSIGTADGSVAIPSLTIANPSFSDVGIYTCNAINALGLGKSDEISLQIIGDVPLVETEAGDYTAQFGENATLKCQVTSNPNHTMVYWIKKVDNTVIKMTSTTKGIHGSTIENPSITIEHVTSTDSGSYTCHADNLVGTSSSRSINVYVNAGAPVVQMVSRNYTTLYGHSIKLECIVNGDPPVRHVFWKKNMNGFITTITPGTIGIQGSTSISPSLEIIFPTKSDSGRYVCLAINDLGERGSLSTELKVLGDLPVVSTKTPFHKSEFGNRYTIECEVDAYPVLIAVYWEHELNGIVRTLKNDTFGISGIFINNPSLSFDFITTSDSGKYTCIAENIIGIGKSETVQLAIIGERPIVEVASTRYTVRSGDDITLSCFITSIPLHTNVYWMKEHADGNVILNHGTTGTIGMTTKNPSLTLKPAFQIDSGLYTCFASNVIGTGASRTVTLKVETDEDDGSKNTNPYLLVKILAPVLGGIGTALATIFGLLWKCCESDPILEIPKSEVTEGETVELICSDKKFLKIIACSWYVKKSNKSDKTRFHKDPKYQYKCRCCSKSTIYRLKEEQTFKTTIQKVTKDHAGFYSCKVKNILRREFTSEVVELSVKDTVNVADVEDVSVQL